LMSRRLLRRATMQSRRSGPAGSSEAHRPVEQQQPRRWGPGSSDRPVEHEDIGSSPSGGLPQHTEDVGLSCGKADRLLRASINKIIMSQKSFGNKLGVWSNRANVFDRAAKVAATAGRATDVTTTEWSLNADLWLRRPVNLQPRSEREDAGFFKCTPNIYTYDDKPANSLVVDFANAHVGGGCFGGGFVQEEQMVAQSSDFACQLHQKRPYIRRSSAISYEGIHMDTWWSRSVAAQKGSFAEGDIQDAPSQPLTILAVDAPQMGRGRGYGEDELCMLAKKVLLIFEVAEQMSCPVILTGLLGGGAFRNNRGLVLLLHLLCQKRDSQKVVYFHHPIFWSFCKLTEQELEENVKRSADAWLELLTAEKVTTLEGALRILLDSRLPLSNYDADLVPDREPV